MKTHHFFKKVFCLLAIMFAGHFMQIQAQEAPDPTWQKFNTFFGIFSPQGGTVPTDHITNVCTDNSGNMYVAGTIRTETYFDGQPDTTEPGYPMPINSTSKGYIIKYNSCGERLWTKYITGNSNGRVFAMVKGEGESLFLTAYVSNNSPSALASICDSAVNIYSNYFSDLALLRYFFIKVSTDGILQKITGIPTGNGPTAIGYPQIKSLEHLGNNKFVGFFAHGNIGSVTLMSGVPNSNWVYSVIKFDEDLNVDWTKIIVDYPTQEIASQFQSAVVPRIIERMPNGNLMVHFSLDKGPLSTWDTAMVFGMPFVYTSPTPGGKNALFFILDSNNGNILNYNFLNAEANFVNRFAYEGNNMYTTLTGVVDTSYFGHTILNNYPYGLSTATQFASSIIKLDNNFNLLWGTDTDSILIGLNPFRTLSFMRFNTGFSNSCVNKKKLYVYDSMGYHTYWGNTRKYRNEVVVANSAFARTYTILTVNKNSGEVEKIDVPISPVEPNSVPSQSTSYEMATNERGEVFLAGKFNNKMVINGDTTNFIFPSTVTNCIIIRYGLPCGTNLSYNQPYAPNQLQANSVGSSTINLNWNDQSGIEWGYRIYRSTQGANGPFTLLDSVGENTATFNNFFLQNSSWYWYKVCAFNNEGCSLESNVDSAFTGVVGTIENYTKNNSLSVHPNPFVNNLFVNLSSFENEDWINIFVYDVLGTNVFYQRIKYSANYQINTSQLLKGIYIVKASNSFGKTAETQIVKVRDE